MLRVGRVGLPLLLLFCDAVAAGGERRRQTVQVVDVCKDAILKILLNKCFERGGKALETSVKCHFDRRELVRVQNSKH